jgi:hypothetical protein
VIRMNRATIMMVILQRRCMREMIRRPNLQICLDSSQHNFLVLLGIDSLFDASCRLFQEFWTDLAALAFNMDFGLFK